MATVRLASLSPADRVADDRQHVLNCRMRLLACAGALAFAGVLTGAVLLGVFHGWLVGLAWLAASGSASLSALGWADRAFIAPLQARCQDDFNRHVEALFGPLLTPHARRR